MTLAWAVVAAMKGVGSGWVWTDFGERVEGLVVERMDRLIDTLVENRQMTWVCPINPFHRPCDDNSAFTEGNLLLAGLCQLTVF